MTGFSVALSCFATANFPRTAGRYVATVILLASAWCAAGATPVWIDTDASIGLPLREVDDGWALVLAFHSPELKIVGISTTYGNASLLQTTQVARDLAANFGGSITTEQVFAGAASRRDLGRRTSATDALAAALRRRKLTYIALGPLTNLATFCQLEPKLAADIDRVVIVGGESREGALRFGPNGWLRIHDANMIKDTAAVRTVLRASVPVTIVPIDCAAQLAVDATDFQQLQHTSEAADYLVNRSRVWMWFWTRFAGAPAAPVFDAAAVLRCARPGLVHAQTCFVSLNDAGELRRDSSGLSRRKVLWCDSIDRSAHDVFLRRLSGRAMRYRHGSPPR